MDIAIPIFDGITALDVIQVVSIIYPWCIQVVRTITMQRQNAGWILRTDSGWQPASLES